MTKAILKNGFTVDKIGFGTWTIGGRSSANPAEDQRSLEALHAALNNGYTHFDTAEMYASGHSERLIGQAIKESGIPRESLFITTKVHPAHLGYESTSEALAGSLRNLDMNYVDLYLIHWPSGNMPLKETFQAMNEMVDAGKIRHLGVSNFSISQLEESKSYANTPIITNQVPYSLAHREYERNGMLTYCQENDILLTAYSPISEGRLAVDTALKEIATAHNATPYQIALAWLVNQPNVITIPMSFNPQHQAENLAAAKITLTTEEMEQLNNVT